MLLNEVEALIQNAFALSQFFLLNPSIENGLRLDDALTKLNYEVSSIEPIARLQSNDGNLSDFLYQCKQLLTSELSSASTRSRLCLVFFNLALYNANIRRFLANDAQLCGPVYEYLQLSIKEKLGPQSVIDILRLLQVLTYEKSVVLDTWTSEFLPFLTSEILKCEGADPIETGRSDAMDHPLPYCMTILCNLVSRSKMIGSRLKKMGNFKQLCRRLLDLLQNNSRTVVVCSLVLIGYLDEKTRDTIFSPQNISQSFLCIFNVLGSSDSLMTVHIAVDLLKRLVISTPAYGPYTVTSTAKNFTSYQFFEKSIQRVAGLLITFDPRSEESVKIFDLLLSFCNVSELRKPVCMAIIQTPKSERRLTTPCLSICRTAGLTFDDAVHPDIPLNALKLLNYLMKEAVEANMKMNDLIPSCKICDLIEYNIKSVVETKSSLVNYQCLRITMGLRLAEAVANDEEIRNDLLEIVSASLCAHINESQLISNPIVGFVNKLRTSASLRSFSDELPDWCLNGVSIPLQLLSLLATLKDYSKIHKDLYWKSLKDERIIPFIAFAISRGDNQIVHDAFVLFIHCAQVQEFPTKLLSDLVAQCTMEFKTYHETRQNCALARQNIASCESLSDYSMSDLTTINHNAFKQIDELLEKMKDGMDITNIHTSQLVCAFEKKVAMHESRERELEQMIAMKEQALSQSERLRTVCQDPGNGEEISNLRLILGDVERKLSETINQNVVLSSENKELTENISNLQRSADAARSQYHMEIDVLQREKNILADENNKERELQVVLRQRFDEMTLKFDIATKTIFDKQQEIEINAQRAVEANQKAAQIQKTLDETNVELAEVRKAVELQTNQLAEQRKEIETLHEENKKLLKIKKAMAAMLND